MAHSARPLGIFAGGRGTRFFGADGGCKALIGVAGRPLVDYILTEGLCSGVQHVCAVVNPQDKDLVAFLSSDSRFARVDIIEQAPTGTFGAVTALMEALGDTEFFLSTGDVIAPPGVLGLLSERLRLTREAGFDPMAVFLASRLVRDDNPIWIHTDGANKIVRYGKGIAPSSLAFGSIRLCTPALKRAAANIARDEHQIRTDTELMSAILTHMPDRFFVAETTAPVFDVDDNTDMQLVERHLREQPEQS